MQIKNILASLIILFLISSCVSTKQISYFQDIQPGMPEQIITPLEIKISPEDKISIVVNSKDPLLADLFNLPIVTHRVGMSANSSLSTAQQVSVYTVDIDGYIDFPVLGKIHIAGMNREKIAEYIKNELIAKELIKDPVVTVEFMNLSISVLGEVNKPGRFDIDRDKMTILDALSMAGDLTIYGKRSPLYQYYIVRNRLLFAWRNCDEFSKYLSLAYQLLIAVPKGLIISMISRNINMIKPTINGINSFFLIITKEKKWINKNPKAK